MLRKHILWIIGRHSRWFSGAMDQKNHETLEIPIVKELISEYGNAGLIKKLFRSNPDLVESNIYFWKTFTNTLLKFGFYPRDSFRIIKIYPTVLSYEEERLENILNEWGRHTHLTIDNLKFLILNRPEFLSLRIETVKNRIPFLLSYCTSQESLMNLLFLCPNVMYDDWQEIIKKMEFLNDDMVVYRTEVIGCKALSKSLEHIKMRFSIIEKCGLYIKPNPHPHKQTRKERMKLNNPKLKDITDKSDYSFARKIAKITLEEYEVYANAFSQYEDEESDLSDSSDEE